jgi:hypothetical protein
MRGDPSPAEKRRSTVGFGLEANGVAASRTTAGNPFDLPACIRRTNHSSGETVERIQESQYVFLAHDDALT